MCRGGGGRVDFDFSQSPKDSGDRLVQQCRLLIMHFLYDHCMAVKSSVFFEKSCLRVASFPGYPPGYSPKAWEQGYLCLLATSAKL